MSVQSLGRTRIVVFEIQFWESQGKVTFGCSPRKKAYNTIWRGVVPPPKGCGPCKTYA